MLQKGLGHLAALYLLLLLVAHYKLSYHKTLLKTAYHFLLLLVGFDTLTYRKDYDRSPILVGHQPTPEPIPKQTPKKRGVLFLSPEDMQEEKKSMKEKGIKAEDVKNLPPVEEIHGLNIPPTEETYGLDNRA